MDGREAVSVEVGAWPAIWLRDNCPCPVPFGYRDGGADLRAQQLARPELALTLRLSPGDCLIFDNTRVLHGRTAFTGTGDRLLQGCYADLDGLASTLTVLTDKEKEEGSAGGPGSGDR